MLSSAALTALCVLLLVTLWMAALSASLWDACQGSQNRQRQPWDWDLTTWGETKEGEGRTAGASDQTPAH